MRTTAFSPISLPNILVSAKPASSVALAKNGLPEGTPPTSPDTVTFSSAKNRNGIACRPPSSLSLMATLRGTANTLIDANSPDAINHVMTRVPPFLTHLIDSRVRLMKVHSATGSSYNAYFDLLGNYVHRSFLSLRFDEGRIVSLLAAKHRGLPPKLASHPNVLLQDVKIRFPKPFSGLVEDLPLSRELITHGNAALNRVPNTEGGILHFPFLVVKEKLALLADRLTPHLPEVANRPTGWIQ